MRCADIIGNEKVAKALASMADSGRVAHAMLMYENEGCGALALAMAYLQYLNCANPSGGDSCGECPSCRQMSKFIHPDVHFVFPVNKGPKSSDEKPTSESYIKYWRELAIADPYFTEADLQKAIGIESKNGLIAVAEAKSIITKLSLASVTDGYKAVVFYLPEKMNQETANRLLTRQFKKISPNEKGGERVARPREPIDLIKAKGKKHLTQAEYEERKNSEIQVPFVDVEPPTYLSAKQKKEFNVYAEMLLKLNIFTELDVDILAQYIIARTLYLKYSGQIEKIIDSEKAVHKWAAIESIAADCEDVDELKQLLEKILRRQRGDDLTVIMNLQDKAFKQCVTCAKELGLTVTSRLKLVIPQPPDGDDEEL